MIKQVAVALLWLAFTFCVAFPAILIVSACIVDLAGVFILGQDPVYWERLCDWTDQC